MCVYFIIFIVKFIFQHGKTWKGSLRYFDHRQGRVAWKFWPTHGWPSPQAEVKTEAEAHQSETALRPDRSHSNIYIHAQVIWWITEMNSAWAAHPWRDSASVLNSALGKGHPCYVQALTGWVGIFRFYLLETLSNLKTDIIDRPAKNK